MKKTLILVLLGYGIFMGNISAQRVNQPTDIFIESVKGTTIYAGVDNMVKIVCPGLDKSEYVVTTDKGVISRTGKELFQLKPNATGLNTVQVLVKDKVQFEKVFQAVTIPDPSPLLGAFQHASDTVQLRKFKAQTGVRLTFEHTALNGKCELVSFRIIKISSSQRGGMLDTKTVINSGPKFNVEATRLMAEANPGDIYIFTDISILCPGDTEHRVLTPMTYFMENNKQ